MPALSLLAGLAWLAGASPGGASCSIPRAESWREYRSASFLLDTDVSASAAELLLKDLEHMRALVVHALFGEDVEIPGRVRVVALGDPRAFAQLAGRDVSAYVTESSFGERIIALPFDGRAPVPEHVAHELAHVISRHHFTRQPRWFGEGLAMFLQTVAKPRVGERPSLGTHIPRGVRGSGGRFAGLAPRDMLGDLGSVSEVPARDLLAWRGELDDAEPGRYHLASWRLYHWLWNRRSAPFAAYQERLSRGEDPEAAWRASFPEYDPAKPEGLDALDGELRRYGRGGRYASYLVDPPVPEVSFTSRALSSAEVHMLLLDARRWPPAEEGAKLEREAIEEALREDPGLPEAIWRRGRLDGVAPAPLLRSAAAARPEDWRAWYLLARSLDGEAELAEKEAALRRAAALAPESSHVQNGLAWLLVTAGRAKEARPFAERALDLAPWNPYVVDTLAAVAAGIGQCEAALQLQRRALESVDPEHPSNQGLRERLEAYEAGCQASAPRAP